MIIRTMEIFAGSGYNKREFNIELTFINLLILTNSLLLSNFIDDVFAHL